jgi:hypothetical protein
MQAEIRRAKRRSVDPSTLHAPKKPAKKQATASWLMFGELGRAFPRLATVPTTPALGPTANDLVWLKKLASPRQQSVELHKAIGNIYCFVTR